MRTTRRWTIFTLVAIAQFMVVLDSAIINVALPAIKNDLGFSNSSIQWVVTIYVLGFGGFLLLGGRVADLFGRRRVLLIGMASFTVFSLLLGLTSSVWLLVVLRGLQGVSAAAMSPAALSIVLTTFEEGHQRSRALGFWSMVATGGAAVGLLLGGVLTQYAGWRWNFFINVPIGLVVGLLIRKYVPAHAREHGSRPKLDASGAVLVTTGLMSAVLAFSQAPTWGWSDLQTLLFAGLAVALLAVFVAFEKRVAHPLVVLAIFRIRNISGANLMMSTLFAGNLGMFFVMTLYLQGVQGYSAISTGLAFVPFPIILGSVSTRMAVLIRRFGYRPFLILGPSIVATGMAWLCFLPVHGSYTVDVLPALLVMPIGYGMSFAPMYASATSGVPRQLAGLASGLVATSQQMGGAIGLAVISGAAASLTNSRTTDSPAGALTAGYNLGMTVCVVFTLVAIAAAVTVIRTPRAVQQTLATSAA